MVDKPLTKLVSLFIGRMKAGATTKPGTMLVPPKKGQPARCESQYYGFMELRESRVVPSCVVIVYSIYTFILTSYERINRFKVPSIVDAKELSTLVVPTIFTVMQ